MAHTPHKLSVRMQQPRVGAKPEPNVALIANQATFEKAGQIAIVLADERERAGGAQPQAASAAVIVVAVPARVVRHVGTDGAPIERRVVVVIAQQRPGLRLRRDDGALHVRELVHLVRGAREDPDPARGAGDAHAGRKVPRGGVAVCTLNVPLTVSAVDDRCVDEAEPEDAVDQAVAPVACDLIVVGPGLEIELDRMGESGGQDKGLRPLVFFWRGRPLDRPRWWRRFGAC